MTDFETNYVHVDDLPQIKHAADHMSALLEMIYGSKDLSDFEFHLEEVLHVLEMKTPQGKITIIKEIENE